MWVKSLIVFQNFWSFQDGRLDLAVAASPSPVNSSAAEHPPLVFAVAMEGGAIKLFDSRPYE
jgi:hypothetical protein